MDYCKTLKLLVVGLALSFFAPQAKAALTCPPGPDGEQAVAILNTYTGRLDCITKTSSNTIVAGSNATVSYSTTTGVYTISSSAGGVGGGLTTLPLPVGSTSYVWITSGTEQSGAFNISSGTVGGQFIVKKAGNGRLTYNPAGSTNSLELDTEDLTNLSSELLFRYNGYSFGDDMMKIKQNNDSSAGLFSIAISSLNSGGSLVTRYQINRISGKQQFYNSQGSLVVEFDPVNNSSFTIPIYASSENVNGQLQVQSIKFKDGTIQVTSATASSGGGGSGSPLEVFNNFDGTRSSPTLSIGLSNDFNGLVSGSTYTIGVKMQKLGTPQYGTLQDFFNLTLSPGQSSGGVISQASASTVNVSSGTGFIKALDSNTTTNYFMMWASSSGVSVPVGNTVYVGVNYNAGVPIISTKSADSWDLDTEFPLGTVVNESGRMAISTIPWITADNMANVIERFDSLAPVSRDNRTGGLVLSNTGTRNVAVTAGTLLARMGEFSVSAIDTSASSKFDNYYRNGSGGFIVQRSSTDWNNTNYDDNSGTLASLTALNYTSRWFYLMIDGSLASLYGQAQYATLAAALNDGTPSSVPDRILRGGMLIGRFIIQASGATPSVTQSAFGTSFTAASVTNFSDLAGTADISSQTNLTATSPLAMSGDAVTLTAISLSTGVMGLVPDANVGSVSASKVLGNNLPAGSTAYFNSPSTMTINAIQGITASTLTLNNLLNMGGGGVSNVGSSSSSFSFGGGLVLNSSLSATSGLYITGNIKSADYTITATDSVIFASAAANTSRFITLPAVQSSTNQVVTIVKVDPSTAPVIIQTNATAQLIAGTTQAFRLFAPGQSIKLESDGLFNWWPLGAVPKTPPTLGETGLDPNTSAIVTASSTYCHSEYVPDFVDLVGVQLNVTAQALSSQVAAYDNFGNVVSTSSMQTIGTGIVIVKFAQVTPFPPGSVWLCFGSQSATTSVSRRSTGANDMGACSFATSLPMPKSFTFPGCTHTANDYAMSGIIGGGIGN